MDSRKVVEIAMSAGEILLSNGAEAYRVEDTIMRICKSYNLNGECISTSTGIYICATTKEGEIVSAIKRIKQRGVDLYRVELINNFSRSLINKLLTYEEAKIALNEIYNAPNFSLLIRLLASSLTSLLYTLFINGTIIDALTSGSISFIVYLLLDAIARKGFFQFMEFYLAGFIIGSASITIQSFFPQINMDNVITGAIIVHLPGVALTNSIKDILFGDYVSGIARFGEAALIIVAMAVGIATALSLLMNIL